MSDHDNNKRIIKQIILPFIGDDIPDGIESDEWYDSIDTASNDWLVYFQEYSIPESAWYKEISHVVSIRAYFGIMSICAPSGDEVRSV